MLVSAEHKKWLSRLARIAVSAGILAFILWRIPLRDRSWTVVECRDGRTTVADAAGTRRTLPGDGQGQAVGQTVVEPGLPTILKHAQPIWWLPAVTVLSGVGVFCGLRWRQLLRVQGINLSAAMATKLTFIGMFFNLFLLGSVGGDLVKAYFVSRHAQARAESMITVLVDRIIGLLGLVWLAGAAMLIWLALPTGRTIPGGLPWAWLTPGAVVLLAGVAFYSQRMRRVLGISRLVDRLRPDHMVRRLDRAIYIYRHHKRAIAAAFALTLIAHLSSVLSIYCVWRSLTPNAHLLPVLLFTPVIFLLAGLVPSIGGLGVQEYGFILFFTGFGAGMEGYVTAVALGLIYRLVSVVVAMPGPLLMSLGMHLPKAAQMQREIAAATGPTA